MKENYDFYLQSYDFLSDLVEVTASLYLSPQIYSFIMFMSMLTCSRHFFRFVLIAADYLSAGT